MMLCRKDFMQQRGPLQQQLTGAFKLTPLHNQNVSPPQILSCCDIDQQNVKIFQQISPQINLGTFCQPV